MKTDFLLEIGKQKMVRPGVFGGKPFTSCSKKNPAGKMVASYLSGKALQLLTEVVPLTLDEGIFLKNNTGEVFAKVLGTGSDVRQILTLTDFPNPESLAALMFVNGGLDDEEVKASIADQSNGIKFLRASDAVNIQLQNILSDMDIETFLRVKTLNEPEETKPLEEKPKRTKTPTKTESVSTVGTSVAVSGDSIEHTGLIQSVASWLNPLVTDVRNIFLFGPQGTGKSIAAHEAAKSAGYTEDEIFTDELYEGVQADHFLGGYVPLESGGFVWREAKFIAAIKTAVSKGKAVIIAEEINFVKSGISGVLHNLLEPIGGIIHLENGEKISVPKTFKVIATCNPGFSGTKDMNPALMDRFQILQPVNELPREVLVISLEKRLQKLGPVKAEKMAKNCLSIYEHFRKKVKEEGRGIEIGPRNLLNWASEIARCGSAADAAERTIIPLAAAMPSRPDEEFANELRSHILKIKLAIM